MKGKNFSCNNVVGKRRKSDFYETPYSMTIQLMNVEQFCGVVLEPAAGKGAIAKVLRTKYAVKAYDLETDFFTETGKFRCIVTNPPYSLAQEFILKAKQVARKKFAFLLPLSYLHGINRLRLIWSVTEFPLARIHVFARYPMLGDKLRPDGCYRTGMMVYAWFIWERAHKGPPAIFWLDNNPYVIGAKVVSHLGRHIDTKYLEAFKKDGGR